MVIVTDGIGNEEEENFDDCLLGCLKGAASLHLAHKSAQVKLTKGPAR